VSPSSKPSAAAVEALVRSIEAKEAAASGVEPEVSATADTPTAAPDPTTAEAAPAATKPLKPSKPAEWSLPPRPVAQRPVSAIAGPGPIPGLIDRQRWEGLIAHEAQRQSRYGQSTAIVVAELDGLDELVDRLGPAAINRRVPPCATLLISLARASDRAARLATGRFGVLPLETDVAGAERYATRATAAAGRWLSESRWDVRLLVGWTATTDPDDLRRGLRTAEDHLRAHRERGA
jgi:GGDEF domain-containing protein